MKTFLIRSFENGDSGTMSSLSTVPGKGPGYAGNEAGFIDLWCSADRIQNVADERHVQHLFEHNRENRKRSPDSCPV